MRLKAPVNRKRKKSGRGLPALQDLADIGAFSNLAKRLGVPAALWRFQLRPWTDRQFPLHPVSNYQVVLSSYPEVILPDGGTDEMHSEIWGASQFPIKVCA